MKSRSVPSAGPRHGGPGRRLWGIPTHKPDLKPARLARKLTAFPTFVALLAAAAGCRPNTRLDLLGRGGLVLARAYDRTQAAWGGDPADAEPWHAMTHAPLHHVVALYHAAGAEVANLPDAAGARAGAAA